MKKYWETWQIYVELQRPFTFGLGSTPRGRIVHIKDSLASSIGIPPSMFFGRLLLLCGMLAPLRIME